MTLAAAFPEAPVALQLMITTLVTFTTARIAACSLISARTHVPLGEWLGLPPLQRWSVRRPAFPTRRAGPRGLRSVWAAGARQGAGGQRAQGPVRSLATVAPEQRDTALPWV